MTEIEVNDPSAFQSRRKTRVTSSIANQERRAFLRLAMAQGIAAPVALATLQTPANAAARPVAPAAHAFTVRKGGMRYASDGRATLHASGNIVRDFADPQLELLRLLREAAEIEHALMLQYLFCAFSLREPYSELAGNGSATSDNILGVAIQEMQHLGAVNRLLVALGSCPHLDRQDFPYEPDIYPFAFQLQSMDRSCLAKFVYCEAPVTMFDPAARRNPLDEAFRRRVSAEFDGVERPNHVGSLYRSVLDMLDEVSRTPNAPITREAAAEWRKKLLAIMVEGEDDHFKFFRSAYEAKHTAFKVSGVDDAWSLRSDHPAYPAHVLPTNPTAFIGHPNQIDSAPALVLAWLGNLHYWISLSSLDYAYRVGDQDATSLAMMQMMSAIWPIAVDLPGLRAGMPFDPLSMGYALGSGPNQSARIVASLGREAIAFARAIEHRLPATYDFAATEALVDYMSHPSQLGQAGKTR